MILPTLYNKFNSKILIPYKSNIIQFIIFIKFLWKLYIKKPIIIFIWHQVSPEFIFGLHNRNYWTSANDFETSIKYLIRKKFVFISLRQAYDILSKSTQRKFRYVVCTFDDGYSTIKDTLPILEKYKLPATFFINTFNTDKNTINQTEGEKLADCNNDVENKECIRNLNDNNQLDISIKKRLYSTREELFDIKNPLFTFGLHGHEHKHHTLMSSEWCMQNLLENNRRLKDHPNFVSFFSFPFGKFIQEEAESFEKLGFKTLSCNKLLNYCDTIPLNRSEMDGKIISLRLLAKQSGETFSFRKMFDLTKLK